MEKPSGKVVRYRVVLETHGTAGIVFTTRKLAHAVRQVEEWCEDWGQEPGFIVTITTEKE